MGDPPLFSLRQRYPEQWRGLKEKREQQKKERLANLEAQLRAALLDHPPRPLRQVALSICYNRKDCYRRWPMLCNAIAQRHLEYQKECTSHKRLALREQVCQIAQEIHQAGVHPTKSRILSALHDPATTCFVAFSKAVKEARQKLNLTNW